MARLLLPTSNLLFPSTVYIDTVEWTSHLKQLRIHFNRLMLTLQTARANNSRKVQAAPTCPESYGWSKTGSCTCQKTMSVISKKPTTHSMKPWTTQRCTLGRDGEYPWPIPVQYVYIPIRYQYRTLHPCPIPVEYANIPIRYQYRTWHLGETFDLSETEIIYWWEWSAGKTDSETKLLIQENSNMQTLVKLNQTKTGPVLKETSGTLQS